MSTADRELGISGSRPGQPVQYLMTALLALGLSISAVALLVFVGTFGSYKVLGTVLGGGVFFMALVISGNPRLVALWALMITMPFDLTKHFGPVIEKMGGETSIRAEVSDPFWLSLGAFLLWDLFRGRRGGLRVPKVTWIWAAIMLMGVGMVIGGPYRMSAAFEVIRMLKLTLLFLVVANELDTPNKMLHCSAALTVAMIVQSTVGMIQFTTRRHLGLDILGESNAGTLDQLAQNSLRGEKAFRVSAFMMHPNIFSVFLAVVLPIAIGIFLVRTGKGFKALSLIGALLGTAALVATLSRSGWVSFASALVLLLTLLMMHHRMRNRTMLLAGIVAAALLTVCIVFAEPIISRLYESKDAAVLSRMEYVDTAVRLISLKPLWGWGLNSYVYVAPPYTKYGAAGVKEKYDNWLPPVHNIYLLWWVETGLIGLILHMTLWGSVVWMAIRNLQVKDDLLFTINAACLAGMLAFGVDGIFSFTMRLSNIFRLFWIVSGIICAIHWWRLRHDSHWSPS